MGRRITTTIASAYRARADLAQRSFNERFWFADGGYLYDVVDAEGGGNDPKCRPNQTAGDRAAASGAVRASDGSR